MHRRDLLKLLGLSFVPLPGLAMGSPEPGRITLSYHGVTVLEAPIEYRLNSTMTIKVEGVERLLRFDSCELYRPGDTEPFLRRDLWTYELGPGHILDITWDVAESRRGDTNPTLLGL